MKSLLLIPALAAAFGLSGCVVTPPTVRPAYVAQPAYVAPPGVVYVQPTYASPVRAGSGNTIPTMAGAGITRTTAGIAAGAEPARCTRQM